MRTTLSVIALAGSVSAGYGGYPEGGYGGGYAHGTGSYAVPSSSEEYSVGRQRSQHHLVKSLIHH
jgi:hypothetical protein